MMTTDHRPELSVIVATHNRRELLRRCLDSLREQSCDPTRIEIIVADDGSTDGTTEMAESLSTRFALRVLQFRKAGQPVAQNEAIQAARGQACLFIDDDTIASPDLLAEHLAAQGPNPAQPGVLGIGALTQRPPRHGDWFTTTFAAAWDEHYDELATRPARWSDCYGGNFSAPRASLIEVGGFATDLPRTLDLDLAFRLAGTGLVPTYLPRAHSVHDDEKSRDRLLADEGLRGKANVELARRHPATTAELLSWTDAVDPRELPLRRLLVALRVPPGPVAALGVLLPGAGRRMLWMHFVRHLAFWSAARRSMTHRQWACLTRADGRPPDESVFASPAP